MATAIEQGCEIALRRLDALSPLDEQNRAAWRRLVGAPTPHRLGATLCVDAEAGYRILIAGWACRVCDTPWGARQIVDILTPGDALGYALNPSAGSYCKIVALTRGISLDAINLAEAIRSGRLDNPQLIAACLAAERAEATRQRDHLVRLGAPTLYQALSDLLLALRRRLDAVGLVDGDRWPMEMTQEALAEALGVGSAQVNRVLGRLRREGLVTTGRHWIETPDLEALAQAAARVNSNAKSNQP